jgi:hypothetical protein
VLSAVSRRINIAASATKVTALVIVNNLIYISLVRVEAR